MTTEQSTSSTRNQHRLTSIMTFATPTFFLLFTTMMVQTQPTMSHQHMPTAFINTPTTAIPTNAAIFTTITPKSSIRKTIIPSNLPHRNKSYLTSTITDKETTTSTSDKRDIFLYNSLKRDKGIFTLQKPSSNTVSMYTCGPTVYDYAHVGNFRAFLTYDILKRMFLYFGYDVDHICNLTDVDDKIINKCNAQDISLKELTEKYTALFMDDLKALNIVPAKKYPKATEHIDEMVEIIEILKQKGLAYSSGNDDLKSWYFNVAEKEGYGEQLVNLNVQQMKKNASGLAGQQRTPKKTSATAEDDSSSEDEDDSTSSSDNNSLDADEYDAEKVGVRDFALWKAYKPEFDRDDATWDTAIGKGRPGWHLECSAMARKYLGDDPIDIHCGGIDLKFPHHENEIAQSEGVTGNTFCNCWVHNGFVNIGDEKMSKSKGNFLTLRGACPTSDDVRAYRYLVVSSQYRNPLCFTKEATGAAKGALKRMDNVRINLDKELDGIQEEDLNKSADDNDMVQRVKKELENFELAIADDLSMPRAAASLFGVIKIAETEFKRFKKDQKKVAENPDEACQPLDLAGLNAVRSTLMQMDKVFGIFYDVPKPINLDGEEQDEDEEDDDSIPEDVMELVRSRSEAKVSKDWDLADSLRARITELGFAVKDVKDGEPIVSRL